MEERSAWNVTSLQANSFRAVFQLWEQVRVQVANDSPSAYGEAPNLARTMLTPAEQMITEALWNVHQVEAVYADRDGEGLLMVFVVVAEHDDDVYEVILGVEQHLVDASPEALELRIRAHQGRDPRKAVPVGTLPLFLR